MCSLVLSLPLAHGIKIDLELHITSTSKHLILHYTASNGPAGLDLHTLLSSLCFSLSIIIHFTPVSSQCVYSRWNGFVNSFIITNIIFCLFVFTVLCLEYYFLLAFMCSTKGSPYFSGYLLINLANYCYCLNLTLSVWIISMF